MEEKSLMIATAKDFRVVPHSEIISVMADGPYSYVFTEKGKYHLCRHLKAINQEFEYSNYLYRVHRSYIINAHKIKHYIKRKRRCFLIMDNGEEIPIAKREKKDFMIYYKKNNTH